MYGTAELMCAPGARAPDEHNYRPGIYVTEKMSEFSFHCHIRYHQSGNEKAAEICLKYVYITETLFDWIPEVISFPKM